MARECRDSSILRHGQLIHSLPVKTGFLAFSPDAGALATAWFDTTRDRVVVGIWRVSDGALMKTYDRLVPATGYYSGIAFGAQGSRLVVGANVTSTINQSTSPRGTLTVLRAPVFFTEVGRTPNGRGVIRWTGGPGPYQLQRTDDLNSEWTNVGLPVTGNGAVVVPASFYRLLALDP